MNYIVASFSPKKIGAIISDLKYIMMLNFIKATVIFAPRICKSQLMSFFDKEYILISRIYQLHPASATMQCLSGNADEHSQK
jgi:hypothetical protein